MNTPVSQDWSHLIEGGVTTFRNQADREGVILAIIGDECLVEYEMEQSQTTSMYIADCENPELFKKNCSYTSIPRRWRAAILAAGLEWIGHPQQSRWESVRLLGDGRVVGVHKLYLRRFEVRSEFDHGDYEQIINGSKVNRGGA